MDGVHLYLYVISGEGHERIPAVVASLSGPDGEGLFDMLDLACWPVTPELDAWLGDFRRQHGDTTHRSISYLRANKADLDGFAETVALNDLDRERIRRAKTELDWGAPYFSFAGSEQERGGGYANWNLES